MRKWLDRCVSGYEYFIAFLFLKGAWDIWHAKAVAPDLHYLSALTGSVAIIVYAILCGVLGFGLLASKILRRRTVHGYVLMVMYLVAFYIVTLSLLVNDWTNGFILSIFYTLSIGALYLYWRYRVMYKKLDSTGPSLLKE